MMLHWPKKLLASPRRLCKAGKSQWEVVSPSQSLFPVLSAVGSVFGCWAVLESTISSCCTSGQTHRKSLSQLSSNTAYSVKPSPPASQLANGDRTVFQAQPTWHNIFKRLIHLTLTIQVHKRESLKCQRLLWENKAKGLNEIPSK